MKECWSEGALRAYLDRELPPDEMERVAAHLEVCSECGDHWAELAGRAQRVSALMNTLPDPDRTVSILRAPPRVKFTTWRWVGAAATLAAGLLLGIVLAPKQQQAPQMTVVAPAPRNVVPPAPDTVVQPTPAVVDAVARPRNTRPIRPANRVSSKSHQSNDGFVALDDEPVDIGVVLRVALGPKGVPADVIFGSDGRPHAIRLVNDKSSH